MDKKHTIVMVRHGESEWKNCFCGWYDVILDQKGDEIARAAGKIIKDSGFKFDIAYTSALMRAQETLQTILSENGQYGIPIEETWRLNARHYGFLTTMSKRDTRTKYNKAQVAFWRRSFDVPPPPIYDDHPYHSHILSYAGNGSWPEAHEFPRCESLKMTIARTLPYWNDVIVPQIKDGKQILISAHGSSLLGIIKHLDQLSDAETLGVKIPPGVPFIYELDEELQPIENGSLKFLGDEKTVKEAMEYVVSGRKPK